MRITIKLGGSILEEPDTRCAVLAQVADLAKEGHGIVLVHGGGKKLNHRLSQLGIQTRFVEGLRVTDEATLAVAVMVLAGEMNKMLVSELGGMGCKALGMCGADAWSIRCTRVSDLPGGVQGLGYVGKPASVDSAFFGMLLAQGLVPVVSSVALGPDFNLYNVNADQMASICARGTRAQALVFLTDVPGVRGSDGLVVRNVTKRDIENLRAQGILSGGMLPKTTACLEALEHGIESVYIVPGSSPGVLASVAQGKVTEGTQIHGKKD